MKIQRSSVWIILVHWPIISNNHSIFEMLFLTSPKYLFNVDMIMYQFISTQTHRHSCHHHQEINKVSSTMMADNNLLLHHKTYRFNTKNITSQCPKIHSIRRQMQFFQRKYAPTCNYNHNYYTYSSRMHQWMIYVVDY